MVVDEDTTNFTGVTIEEQSKIAFLPTYLPTYLSIYLPTGNNPLFDDAAIDELEEQVNQLGIKLAT